MRFVGRVAILLVVVLAAAVVHSLEWPIYRDVADQRSRMGLAAPQRSAEADPDASMPPDQDSPTREDATGEAPAGDPAIASGGADPSPADLPDYYISIDRAFQYWEEGMPFVDARTDREREVGTIEGAFHLETRNFIDSTAVTTLDLLDRAFPVVIFCGGGECDASENVAKRLIGWGFTEVYVMHEGFGAWEAAGHPTEPVEGG